MAMVNRYASRSKIFEARFRQLVKLFAIDLDASQIVRVTKLNSNAVNRYLMAIRQRVAEFCEQQAPVLDELELDESYFGPRRVKVLRGRGASCKTIVFGIFRRQRGVFAEIEPDCNRATPNAVIRGRVSLERVIPSGLWRGNNGLVDLGYQKHFRVNHGENEFANEHTHTNGIESCWGYAKTRLASFRSLCKNTFFWYLKECAFRFNHRG